MFYTGHTKSVWCLAASPDGTTIASGSSDATVHIWRPAKGYAEETLRCRDYVSGLAWMPDGSHIATVGGDQEVHIWDATSGKVVAQLRGHEPVGIRVALWPLPDTLITAGSDFTARVWRVWDIEQGWEGEQVCLHPAQSRFVRAAAWVPSRGGAMVASADDKTVSLWDASNGHPRLSDLVHEKIVQSVSCTPDGSKLVVAAGSEVYVWDLERPDAAPLLVYSAHMGEVNIVSCSPDGQYVASGSGDETVRVWHITSGHKVSVFRHHSSVHALAWSKSGRSIVSGDASASIFVWNADDGEQTVDF
jgi:WD40 repeat protein